MTDDIVLAFLRQMLELYPQTPEVDARRIEVTLRRDWGGTAIYVRKQAPPEEKALRQARSLAAGASHREALDCVGISRVTGWRLRRRFTRGW